jgi:hypothetical protein
MAICKDELFSKEKKRKNISAQSVYWQANCITADEKEKKKIDKIKNRQLVSAASATMATLIWVEMDATTGAFLVVVCYGCEFLDLALIKPDGDTKSRTRNGSFWHTLQMRLLPCFFTDPCSDTQVATVLDLPSACNHQA